MESLARLSRFIPIIGLDETDAGTKQTRFYAMNGGRIKLKRPLSPPSRQRKERISP